MKNGVRLLQKKFVGVQTFIAANKKRKLKGKVKKRSKKNA
jgi:hypothetical protein